MMLILSNKIIETLLIIDQSSPENILDEFTAIWEILDIKHPYNDIELISDESKKAIADASYPVRDTKDDYLFLICFALDVFKKNNDSDITYAILIRLLKLYKIAAQFKQQNTTMISPTEEYASKSLPASEIISRLIQDPNDTNRDAYFALLFLETNITHDTQETIIASIKAAKKDYPDFLKDLKTMVNHYIYNHPEHYASIASILDANTASHNGLLFILCIGQTFFKVSNDGKNLNALKDFIAHKPNPNLAKYGFFAEVTPGAAYTPPKSLTPSTTPHPG